MNTDVPLNSDIVLIILNKFQAPFLRYMVDHSELKKLYDTYFKEGVSPSLDSMDCLDMAIKVVGKEKCMNFLLAALSENLVYPLDYSYQLALIDKLGCDDFISKFEDIIKNRNERRELRILKFILESDLRPNKDPCIERVYPKFKFMKTYRAFCEMHIRNLNHTGMSGLNYFMPLINRQHFLKSAYTSREAVSALFNYAAEEIAKHDRLYLFNSNKYNRVVQFAMDKDKQNIQYTILCSAEAAVGCLALSGTQHPDMLKWLQYESLLRVLDEMDAYGVRPDSRELIKIEPKLKSRLLERDLGL